MVFRIENEFNLIQNDKEKVIEFFRIKVFFIEHYGARDAMKF